MKGINHLEYTVVNGYPCGLFYVVVSVLEHEVSMVECLVTDDFEKIRRNWTVFQTR